MAFTDELIADSDSDVVMVDRRHRPGGHWNDAYPFVRLHQPAPFYGVNSRRLGTDVIDNDGSERGLVPALKRRRDLRVLWACPRRDLAAFGPGAVLRHVRLRGGQASRAPVRVAADR
ncbi:MAG TPA: hypothetical protein VEZ15_05480 [Acidimicrobiia bacterium]|nr:hypothetical protein [Acidimicrobiia bacterium]